VARIEISLWANDVTSRRYNTPDLDGFRPGNRLGNPVIKKLSLNPIGVPSMFIVPTMASETLNFFNKLETLREVLWRNLTLCGTSVPQSDSSERLPGLSVVVRFSRAFCDPWWR
jgi:hypothetical protein